MQRAKVFDRVRVRALPRAGRSAGLTWLLLGAAFVVGLGLRLWGIGFGLPELFHPDEPAYVLQALAVVRGLPDGLTFANPPLYKYLLAVEYIATYGVQRLSGAVGSPQDFVTQFRADPSQLYAIARLTSAALGAATSLAAFALGAVVHNRRVGLIAAFLTAATYLLVRDAHFGVNDTLVTLLVTSGLVFCVRIAHGGGRRDYVLAGAIAGLAFAAKYHGIALLAPLVAAHALRAQTRSHKDLVPGLGACIAAAIVAFPSLATETARVVQDVYLHLYFSAIGGYDGLDPAGGYVYYARTLVVGLGWPLLVLAMAGVVMSFALRPNRRLAEAVRTRHRAALVVAVLPFVLIGVLGAQQLFFARFLLPAVPALLVEAALVLDAVMDLQLIGGFALMTLAVTPTLIDSVRFDVLLTRADTRSQARAWVASSVPAGATIAVDSPPLGPNLALPRHQVLEANDSSLFDLTLAHYRARGIDYVVISSFTSEARKIDPTRDARRRAFYAALPVEAEEVAQFRPHTGDTPPPFVYDVIYGPFGELDRLERPGPTVTVYRLSGGRGTPP